MPRPSIDYLTARASARPASGGRRYKLERNAVDDRAQFAGLDIWEQTMLRVEALQADFRSWAANLAPVDQSLDDLTF